MILEPAGPDIAAVDRVATNPTDCVGIVRGPGESAHEYVFLTPDRNQKVKSGEFVTYDAVVDGLERRIFGRVGQRAQERRYPSGFLADPEVAPSEIAGMLGYDPDLGGTELDAVTVTILGYYDPEMKDFMNPRQPPRQGTPVRIAGDEELSLVLSKKQKGEVGSAHVGDLLSRPPGAAPIVLDVREITSTHLAIIAGTGSGKSYLAGVLIEELMMAYNRAAVLIVDPHGECDTLAEIANEYDFDDPDGYRPRARVFRPENIKVRVSGLTRADFRYLLPDLSEKMTHILESALKKVASNRRDGRTDEEGGVGVRWTLEDLHKAVDEVDPAEDGKSSSTADALHWRLDSVLKRSSTIFDDFQNLPLLDLFSPGQCTILQLNEVDHREQQVVVATLLRRLYQARLKTVKQAAAPGDELYLPFPIFVVIEEAHNFAPYSGDGVASGILKQILSEGRKFGVAVGLISQRPGRLDADVLSQCMTQFLLRIVNPLDQESISRSVESVGRDLLKELPALSKGQALLAGRAVNTPMLCRVRKRLTPHGAEDLNAPAEWIKYQQEDARTRDRNERPPIRTDRVELRGMPRKV